MKAIEQRISDAIFNSKRFSGGNTVVLVSDDKTECILHGHKIFSLNRDSNDFEWNDCGWQTRTTASRLNACFNAVSKLTGACYHYNFGRGEVLDSNGKSVFKTSNLK